MSARLSVAQKLSAMALSGPLPFRLIRQLAEDTAPAQFADELGDRREREPAVPQSVRGHQVDHGVPAAHQAEEEELLRSQPHVAARVWVLEYVELVPAAGLVATDDHIFADQRSSVGIDLQGAASVR